jgi:hypothetical protein
MNEVFVIRNQHGHFWGKSKAWQDGKDNKAVMRVKHQDEALNTLVELSAKDVELRGEILPCEVDSKGNPIVEASLVPLPSAEQEPQQALLTEDAPSQQAGA